MDEQLREFAGLEYIKAEGVRSSDGNLDGFAVHDACGAPLGELAGVLVDTAGERLRYLVVSQWRGSDDRLSVLPLDGVRLDPEHHAVVLFESLGATQPQAAA